MSAAPLRSSVLPFGLPVLGLSLSRGSVPRGSLPYCRPGIPFCTSAPHPPSLQALKPSHPAPPTSFPALKGKNIHVSPTSSGLPEGQTSPCVCLPWSEGLCPWGPSWCSLGLRNILMSLCGCSFLCPFCLSLCCCLCFCLCASVSVSASGSLPVSPCVSLCLTLCLSICPPPSPPSLPFQPLPNYLQALSLPGLRDGMLDGMWDVRGQSPGSEAWAGQGASPPIPPTSRVLRTPALSSGLCPGVAGEATKPPQAARPPPAQPLRGAQPGPPPGPGPDRATLTLPPGRPPFSPTLPTVLACL